MSDKLNEVKVSEANRFEAKQVAGSGTWMVYDNMRKVSILKTISPNAIYNESVVKETVELLNKNKPKTH